MAEIRVSMGSLSIGTVIIRGQLIQVASVGHGGATSDLYEDRNCDLKEKLKKKKNSILKLPTKE
jgi:hypothetical protein